ncbi:MAG: hypothetical protein AAGA12_15740 [Pseudomonadota bacterium]
MIELQFSAAFGPKLPFALGRKSALQFPKADIGFSHDLSTA